MVFAIKQKINMDFVFCVGMGRFAKHKPGEIADMIVLCFTNKPLFFDRMGI